MCSLTYRGSMKVKLAAIRFNRTGEIFTDTCHAFAYLHVDIKLGYDVPCDNCTEGFVLSDGTFVDRFEAYEIAEQNNQLDHEVNRTGFAEHELISEACLR